MREGGGTPPLFVPCQGGRQEGLANIQALPKREQALPHPGWADELRQVGEIVQEFGELGGVGAGVLRGEGAELAQASPGCGYGCAESLLPASLAGRPKDAVAEQRVLRRAKKFGLPVHIGRGGPLRPLGVLRQL